VFLPISLAAVAIVAGFLQYAAPYVTQAAGRW
jgi:hypothetical protein